MKKLYENFEDRHSMAVLRQLNDSQQRFETYPLLQRLRDGVMPLQEFIFFSRARLDAATNFVPFLSAAHEKVDQSKSWKDMASAMRNNLNEELGLIKGVYIPEEDHETWRENYRAGLKRICNLPHNWDIPLILGIDVRETTDAIDRTYSRKLKRMPKKKSVPYLAGAFTALEGILEREFSAIHAYIKQNIPEFTSEEALYIAHHAGHEHRHRDEAAMPLLQTCSHSPHNIPEVIDGIRDMTELRLRDVLGNISTGIQVIHLKK